MSCPYFKDHYFGFCTRSNSSYVPSIAEMEDYCFTDGFTSCPIFETQTTKEEELKGRTRKNWLHDIYSDPLVLLKAEGKTKSK